MPLFEGRYSPTPDNPLTSDKIDAVAMDANRRLLVGSSPTLATSMSSIADVTVGTSKVQLSVTSAPAISGGILVTTHPTNSAVVRISGSDVTSSKGQPLGPGASYTFPVSNANALWAVSESGSQTVCVSLL